MKKPKSTTLLRMPKRRGTITFAVESRILFLRHQRVILDADIAELYGVPVKVLNQQISAIENGSLRILSFNLPPKSTNF
jgi:hypothetical protein